MKQGVSKITGLLIIIFGLFCLNSAPVHSAGATLFLSPAKSEIIVGNSFSVKVMVNSGGGVGINASEGTLSFDTAYLTIESVSETGSIFELWTEKPSYSNISGSISYGGGLPSAYKGDTGAIFTITFKSKKVGTTEVKFNSGVVLAADGKGTNVFEGFGNGSYTIKEAEVKEEPEKREPPAEEKETIKGILPPAPEVSSETHGDQNTWYANNTPQFSWKLLSDITGVSIDITDTADSDPGSKSDGIVESKVYERQEDGEWYFHIKYQNRVGWGKITHRKFLVDATPPSLNNVRVNNEGDPTNPVPLLQFNTEDVTSGVANYSILLNNAPYEIDNERLTTNAYRFNPLAPGEYDLGFAVFDKAGNSASSSLKFTIDALKPPIITDIPKIITTKDELIIRGTSFYPNVTVKIYFAQEGGDPEEAQATTDEQGSWNYFHRRSMDKGIYEVWAKIVDQRGAQSLNSAKYVLTVIKPSIIDAYGWLIILILLIIIVLLTLYIIYLKQSFKDERKRIRREITEAKQRLSDIFLALREEVDELMELADKKAGLSESERRVKEKLQEALNISQEFLDKEMEDVEKEIKSPKKE